MKEVWTSMASILGVVAFCQGLISTILPPELRRSILKLLHRIITHFSSYSYFDITEIDGVNTNELYNAVQLYLSSAAASTTSSFATHLSLSRSPNSSSLTFGLSHNDTLFDTFHGIPLRWEHIVVHRPPSSFSWRPVPDEKRAFTLRVGKGLNRTFLGRYLDYIVAQAGEIRRRSQDRYLYTNTRGGCGSSLDPSWPGSPWEAVPFKHPSTFSTLAMSPAKKARLMADLKDFAEGEAFYRVTGRAWKRGYLLHGPPGTGKSSMIAAMANYLSYDVYDLELTEVSSNSELRKLLMKTTPKSIIVIEDIDCSLDLHGSRPAQKRTMTMSLSGPAHDGEGGSSTVTLSGLLGFTDGLWSCCGNERIFVLTTNHVERIDAALLRSGRMDVRIHMGYCMLEGLEILVRNYVGLEGLSREMKEGLEGVVENARMTPADVSEVLIRNRKRGEKAAVVAEVVEEMKRRAVEREDGGRKLRDEEVEEQEKRELEMHNGGAGEEGKENDSGVVVDFQKDNNNVDYDDGKKFN